MFCENGMTQGGVIVLNKVICCDLCQKPLDAHFDREGKPLVNKPIEWYQKQREKQDEKSISSNSSDVV